MQVVIDSNLLFRMLISQGEIILLFFDARLEIFAPIKLKEEFSKHRQELITKSGLLEESFDELAEILFKRISFISALEYLPYLGEARELLKGHKKDEDFLALALSKNCKIWTYESRFFTIGYAVSTKELANSLA